MTRSDTVAEAVRLTDAGDITSLSELLRTNPIPPELLFRILLTYLPDSLEPESYLPLIQEIETTSPGATTRSSGEPVAPANKVEIDIKASNLRLVQLAHDLSPSDDDVDPLTLFLIHQAHRIDQTTGSLDLVRRLIEPFVHHSETLRVWAISTLLPLLRLEYEYSPSERQSYTIDRFERLSAKETLKALLPKRVEGEQEVDTNTDSRDIKGLVGPWMYGETARKRRKLAHAGPSPPYTDGGNGRGEELDADLGFGDHGWSYVNDWILQTSRQSYDRVSQTIYHWDGPADVDCGEWKEEFSPMDETEDIDDQRGYVQTILAVIVTSSTSSNEDLATSIGLLDRACALSSYQTPPNPAMLGKIISQGFIDGIAAEHMSIAKALRRSNPLTYPSPSSIAFIFGLLTAASKLAQLGVQKSCQDLIQLILFRSAEAQKAELQRLLQRLRLQKSTDQTWIGLRLDLLWLRDWESSTEHTPNDRRGMFGQISPADLELEILRAILDAGHYRLSVDLYLKKAAPLDEVVVKETILSTAFAHYDAATNGNKTRGQMKKAFDIVQFFKGQFSSTKFAQLEALLAATHSMSFYSLSLQPGVSVLPVNIRAHRDPMSLIEKILQQNRGSYTHLDDLLDIGQNLVCAGLGQSGEDQLGADLADDENLGPKKLIARRRVTRMAIEAALAEDDFDTAYSYVVNRLHREANSDAETQRNGQYDDVSWRAAYAAGRHPTSHDGTSALRRIEQRMELLSQALLLAPPEALPELLAVWQTCEENLNEVLAQDAAQDDEADLQNIPGGFIRGDSPRPQKSRAQMKTAIQEEAPLGLFDAAREVGAALGKSAFPLRGLQRGSAPGPASQEREREHDDADGAEGSNRVRKRDMVSNIVTGGLASGIGWVIGAPPVRD